MKQGIPWDWPKEKRKVGQMMGVWPPTGGEEEGWTADGSFCCRVSVEMKLLEEVAVGRVGNSHGPEEKKKAEELMRLFCRRRR